MSYLLLPISIFIKSFDISVSTFYISQLPVYLYTLLIISIFIMRLFVKTKPAVWTLFNKKVLIFSAIILGSQIIALGWSYISLRNSVFERHPEVEFSKLVILLICISIHYFIVKIAVSNEQDITNFFRGMSITLLLLLVISYFQFLYLIFPTTFSKAVSFLGHFEYRYNRNWWYSAGSYVQTTRRINGFNPESDFLASQFLVIFIPFILASIKNRVNLFAKNSNYHPTLYFSLLLAIMIILFFAKTTTGILAIGIILIALWLLMPGKKKIFYAGIILMVLIVFFIFAMKYPVLKSVVDSTLLNKWGGDSMLNRTGGTIGLIVTWLTHPIFGVGFNYHDYYLFRYVPKWTTLNYEFIRVFAPHRFYPILSVLFGWLAEFGTVFVIIISVYVLRLLKDFRTIAAKANQSNIDGYKKKKIQALKDAAFYFFSFYFICSLLSFNWYESMYLITIFFFVGVRHYLKSKFIKEKVSH